MQRRYVWIATLMLTVSSAAAAQTDSTVRAKPRQCWRGQPAPRCGTFWITEYGYTAVVTSPRTTFVDDIGNGTVFVNTVPDFDSRLTWTVGPMFNVGQHQARGGTISVSPVNTGYRASLEARQRWWTDKGIAVDLSAGAVRMNVPSANLEGSAAGYGLTAGTYLVGADLLNVTGRADLILGRGRPRLGTSVGIGLGSYGAVAGTVVTGILTLLAFAIIAGEGT